MNNLKRSYIFIIIFLFTVGLVAALYYFLVVNKKVLNIQEKVSNEESDIVVESPVVDINVVKDAVKNKEYKDIQSERPDLVYNPNVANKDIKDEIIKNNNAFNHRVSINGSSVDPEVVVGQQGDFVTFFNNSNFTVNIMGENNWALYEIFPNRSLVQEFSFKGNYQYEVVTTEDSKVIGKGSITITSISE